MGAEKRRYRRLETDLEARLKNLGDPNGAALSVRIVNLGPEGAFVASEGTIPVQSQVALDFKIDSYPKEINVIAKILWHKKASAPLAPGAEPQGGETEKGMGMQFVHIPLFEKNIIIDYILRRYAEHQAKRGGGAGGGD